METSRKTTLRILSFITLLCFTSCSSDDFEVSGEMDTSLVACGVTYPQKNLPWLKELIEKAEKDATGNYYGWIFLEQFKGKDIFVINMMLGSGGLMYHLYDCSGNSTDELNADHPDHEDFETFLQTMELKTLVYSNTGIPYD